MVNKNCVDSVVDFVDKFGYADIDASLCSCLLCDSKKDVVCLLGCEFEVVTPKLIEASGKLLQCETLFASWINLAAE